MPLQNRVLPTGEIVAQPWRGALMGNRGCLHDIDKTLGRAQWRHRNWVCCVTDFRGRHRLPMPPPGSPTVYTALFFWDEATAFAAGHRPCGECRNAEYRRFKALWQAADLGDNSATEMDRTLHAARLPRLKGITSGEARNPADLPTGTIIRLPDAHHAVGYRTGVLSQGQFYPWLGTGGYGAAEDLAEDPVEVLTPLPILAIYEAGYLPFVRLDPKQQFTTRQA